MLDAILFAIRSVSAALAIYLNVPVKLSENQTIRLYWVFMFFFIIYWFLKFLRMNLSSWVDVKGKKN